MPARRPFNPSKARGGASPQQQKPSALDANTWTVSQVNARIKEAIFQHIPPTIVVAGEIGNYKRHSSGHVYFTLKDDRSELACVMWRSSASNLKFTPESGMAILATGNLDVYEARGTVQMYVRKMEPQGVGQLELAFRQMREKLEKEGLFDPEKKKPLPVIPRRIAVVTSPTGAAIRDILRTLQRRFPAAEILVYPVKVQGEGAAKEIAAAINHLSKPGTLEEPVDVIIAGRGGGSLEDLWAFNEEPVARAIFACTIPIVSAVGHEVDVTISDLVADVRAATPTAAAEFVAPDCTEVIARIDQISRRLLGTMQRNLQLGSTRLSGILQRRTYSDPLAIIQSREQRLDDLQTTMTRLLIDNLHRTNRVISRCEVLLQMIHPGSYVADRKRALSEQLHALKLAYLHRIQKAERLVSLNDSRLTATKPIRRIAHLHDKLEHQQNRLSQTTQNQLKLLAGDLESIAGRLRTMSYKSTLARGFTITRLKKGKKVLRNPDDLQPGDKIITQFEQGDLESQILDTRQKELFD